MNNKAIIADCLNSLRESADQKRKEWAKGYYPTSLEVIGVTAPDIKRIVEELRKNLKGEDPASILQLAKDFVNTGVFECLQLAFELLNKNKNALRLIGRDELIDLMKGMDNWVTVDTFSCYISGWVWRENQIPDTLIHSWLSSENKWWRRIAVVSTIPLNQKARGGKGDTHRTLQVCKKVVADKDDMIIKALSWALRELSKTDKESVTAFMHMHENVLAGRVKREVWKKLETGRKNG
jgi:3-methyladenine DNA glycosylase AlkD